MAVVRRPPRKSDLSANAVRATPKNSGAASNTKGGWLPVARIAAALTAQARPPIAAATPART